MAAKKKKSSSLPEQRVLPAFLDLQNEESSELDSFFLKFDNLESTEKKPKELAEDTPVIRSVVPSRSLQTKDKISLTILDQHVINQGEQKLQMAGKNSIEPVVTRLNVTLDMDELLHDNSGIVITRDYEFTYYDKAVFDALCSLINAGNELISFAMIARMMTGKNYSYHPTEKTIDMIEQSVKKMSKMMIRIDISEEWKAFKNLNTSDAVNERGMIIEERFFNYRTIRAFSGGKTLSAIEPLSVPALFRYASMRRQISSIDLVVLDTPVVKTRPILSCQGYLLQRITAMKSSKKLSRIILFDKIYAANEDLELIKEENKNNYKYCLKSIQTSVCSILDYWVSIKFIKGYKIHRSQYKKYGKIEIILDEDVSSSQKTIDSECSISVDDSHSCTK